MRCAYIDYTTPISKNRLKLRSQTSFEVQVTAKSLRFALLRPTFWSDVVVFHIASALVLYGLHI